MSKKYFFYFAICYSLLPFLALAQATGQVDFTNVVPDIASPQGTRGAGFIGWIQNFYQFSLIAGVFLAVGVIAWAGLRYALAAGNPSGQSDARDQILQALLGLILLFGAYLILFTINPNLVNLSLPTLSSVSVGMPAAVSGPRPIEVELPSELAEEIDSNVTVVSTYEFDQTISGAANMRAISGDCADKTGGAGRIAIKPRPGGGSNYYVCEAVE